MGMFDKAVAAWRGHPIPDRNHAGWMRATVAEATPADEADETYLAGVDDTLQWMISGAEGWQSDALVAAIQRRHGVGDDDTAGAAA